MLTAPLQKRILNGNMENLSGKLPWSTRLEQDQESESPTVPGKFSNHKGTCKQLFFQFIYGSFN